MYRWIITKDNITRNEFENSVGMSGPEKHDELLVENRARFSLWDKDGDCCFEGTLDGDYEGFEPLDDFGLAQGCTGIKLNGEWL